MNVTLPKGPKEERLMTTGLHTVADIYCNQCLQIVGWKYVSPAAVPLLQKYFFSHECAEPRYFIFMTPVYICFLILPSCAYKIAGGGIRKKPKI